jgi:hypothetical protein
MTVDTRICQLRAQQAQLTADIDAAETVRGDLVTFRDSLDELVTPTSIDDLGRLVASVGQQCQDVVDRQARLAAAQAATQPSGPRRKRKRDDTTNDESESDGTESDDETTDAASSSVESDASEAKSRPAAKRARPSPDAACSEKNCTSPVLAMKVRRGVPVTRCLEHYARSLHYVFERRRLPLHCPMTPVERYGGECRADRPVDPTLRAAALRWCGVAPSDPPLPPVADDPESFDDCLASPSLFEDELAAGTTVVVTDSATAAATASATASVTAVAAAIRSSSTMALSIRLPIRPASDASKEWKVRHLVPARWVTDG